MIELTRRVSAGEKRRPWSEFGDHGEAEILATVRNLPRQRQDQLCGRTRRRRVAQNHAGIDVLGTRKDLRRSPLPRDFESAKRAESREREAFALRDLVKLHEKLDRRRAVELRRVRGGGYAHVATPDNGLHFPYPRFSSDVFDCFRNTPRLR